MDRKGLAGAGFAAALLASCLGSQGPSGSRAENLFEVSCARCHSIEVPLSRRKTLEGWKKTIWAMRQRGADLTDQQAEEIAQYLARVQGK